MGFPAGMRRDFAALEARRLEAARLLKQGLSEAEVARQVGVHRQSVNRWAKQLADGGRSALRHPGRAGRKPKLTEADRRRITNASNRRITVRTETREEADRTPLFPTPIEDRVI